LCNTIYFPINGDFAMKILFLFIEFSFLVLGVCASFHLALASRRHSASTVVILYNNENDNSPQLLSQWRHDATDRGRRRRLVQGIFTTFTATLTIVGVPTAILAKENVQDQQDKEMLVAGLARLNYLLDNWEKETTICGNSDNPYIGLCERNPIKVMDYMGYKSTADPLFKADARLKRLALSVSLDDNKVPAYLDAMEKWAEAAEEASGMAYVSSWGESNPGGGKDRVAYFIERAKKNVVDARDSLATALEILGVAP
jgi:hypothetical protein